MRLAPALAAFGWLVQGAVCLADAPPAESMEGFDRAWVLPPAGVQVTAYENAGYRMRVVSGIVEIDVDASALASRASFHCPSKPARDPIASLARRLAGDAESEYAAVSRVLDWVARNVRYDLDRERAQEARAVLERRSGYCTGIARLSVALLAALGLEAREVAGYVVADPASQLPAGFHRWIEVYYPDRGWVFSDPKRSHHFVPAQYMRLASEALEGERGPALLLARENRLEVVDLYRGAPAGIAARRNDPRQLSAALKVELLAPGAGELVLAGARSFWRLPVAGFGAATFVGLAPGEYHLQLLVDGRAAAERTLRFRAPVRASLQLSNRE